MPRLVVIVPPELAAGYELAGASTVTAEAADQACDAIRDLLDRREAGVIAVHEPFLGAVDARLRQRLESEVIPVVVALPSGQAGAREARRARLAAVLRQAVGQRIGFRREEP
jgi:vacuolar-type H+-ATPase subunit F/Vma7